LPSTHCARPKIARIGCRPGGQIDSHNLTPLWGWIHNGSKTPAFGRGYILPALRAYSFTSSMAARLSERYERRAVIDRATVSPCNPRLQFLLTLYNPARRKVQDESRCDGLDHSNETASFRLGLRARTQGAPCVRRLRRRMGARCDGRSDV